MTPTSFRRIVLGLDGVTEGSHMGHPDFRAANGRIFASLTADEKKGMAILTPDEQARFISDARGAFAPAAGAWGRQGCTTIELAKADAEMVGEALTLAWQKISAAKAARKRSPAKKLRKPR
jgi:hypothetical protein